MQRERENLPRPATVAAHEAHQCALVFFQLAPEGLGTCLTRARAPRDMPHLPACLPRHVVAADDISEPFASFRPRHSSSCLSLARSPPWPKRPRPCRHEPTQPQPTPCLLIMSESSTEMSSSSTTSHASSDAPQPHQLHHLLPRDPTTTIVNPTAPGLPRAH